MQMKVNPWVSNIISRWIITFQRSSGELWPTANPGSITHASLSPRTCYTQRAQDHISWFMSPRRTRFPTPFAELNKNRSTSLPCLRENLHLREINKVTLPRNSVEMHTQFGQSTLRVLIRMGFHPQLISIFLHVQCLSTILFIIQMQFLIFTRCDTDIFLNRQYSHITTHIISVLNVQCLHMI